jgi:creatinine amidohydrolase
VELSNRPWVDFDAIRQETDLVIFPTGAVEVYGPHLPAGSDSVVVTHVARQVGEQVNAVILPTMPVGFSRGLGGFPGTLNISPSTVEAFVFETASSLVPWGMKRFLFINNHRGNQTPIDNAAMEMQDRYGVKCAQVFWWDFVAPLIKDIVPGRGHGGEIATAILLAVQPDLVVMDRIKNPPPYGPIPYPDITRYNGGVDRLPHGVGGRPEDVDAEQGKEVMRRGVDRIVAFVNEVFGGPGRGPNSPSPE